MITIDPAAIPPRDFYQYLIGAVAPRPIAFISTLDGHGIPNLAPYSFFNAFGGNPPVVAFSAARRKGPVPEKDTLNNVQINGELVVNSVSYNIVRQMALTSIEFPPGTDEFEKAGFTKLPSAMVAPFRVAESHIQMECRVQQMVPLMNGEEGTTLVICRVLLMHINPQIMGENGRIDPQKADLMGRMGRQYYARASGDAVIEIAQNTQMHLSGFDQLPKSLRESKILTGNQLAQLVNALGPQTITLDDVETADVNGQDALHQKIAALIDAGDVAGAVALVAR